MLSENSIQRLSSANTLLKMDDANVESQDPPQSPTEVKEEQPAETMAQENKVPEVVGGNATTPAIEPEAAPTPTSAPVTGLTKQVVGVIEGMMHRLITYKNEE